MTQNDNPAGARPRVKPLSVGLYLWSVVASGFMGMALSVVATITMASHPFVRSYAAPTYGIEWLTKVMPPLALGGLCLMYAGIVSLVLWYKAWAALQDGRARTTPGKAIGLLFVPFYNLYWVFVCFWGLAREHNRFIRRHSLDVGRMPEALFLLYCIWTFVSAVCSFIPVLKFVAPVVSYVIWMACVSAAVRAVNRLAQPAAAQPAA